MTTSTPPEWQWHWLSECDVPVTTAEESLSVDLRNLPAADTLRGQNDSPDQTYQDCWPSARYLSDGPDDSTPESAWAHMASQVGATVKEPLTVDQCDDCRCAPGQPHAPGCDTAAQLTDAHSNAAPSHRIGTCYLDPDTGETVMPADFFGEKELRWPAAQRWHGHDGEPVVTAESCPECGTVTDLEYGVMDKGVDMNEEPAVETHEDLQGKDVDKTLDTLDPTLDETVKDKPPDCQATLAALMAEGYREMACDPEPARSAIGAGPVFRSGPEDVEKYAPGDAATNPLLDHMECTFNSCMDIAIAKNEGYAGSADPMANFNDSVRLGVPVPIGVALRLSDKWARLCRLLQTGENPLADESITDTIMDAINYLAILLYAMEDETSIVTDKCRGSGPPSSPRRRVPQPRLRTRMRY